jgi:hypothetical protein
MFICQQTRLLRVGPSGCVPFHIPGVSKHKTQGFRNLTIKAFSIHLEALFGSFQAESLVNSQMTHIEIEWWDCPSE